MSCHQLFDLTLGFEHPPQHAALDELLRTLGHDPRHTPPPPDAAAASPRPH